MHKNKNTKTEILMIMGIAGIVLLVFSWIAKPDPTKKVAVIDNTAANSCVDDQSVMSAAVQENPNMNLFVSCAGFLE